MRTMQEYISADEAEILAIYRAARDACTTDVSGNYAATILASMALARRAGLAVTVPTGTLPMARNTVKRIRESMARIWF